MSIINKIPNLSDEELLRLFKNAFDLIERKKSEEQANHVLQGIQNEWELRLKKHISGDYKPERPKIGILSSLGYSVGESGVKSKRRRLIIDYIINGTLPFVGSPAYMAEWGGPFTGKRYHKLQTVLSEMVLQNKNKGWDKAIIEWNEDLGYLRETWKHKLNNS